MKSTVTLIQIESQETFAAWKFKKPDNFFNHSISAVNIPRVAYTHKHTHETVNNKTR